VRREDTWRKMLLRSDWYVSFCRFTLPPSFYDEHIIQFCFRMSIALVDTHTLPNHSEFRLASYPSSKLPTNATSCRSSCSRSVCICPNFYPRTKPKFIHSLSASASIASLPSSSLRWGSCVLVRFGLVMPKARGCSSQRRRKYRLL